MNAKTELTTVGSQSTWMAGTRINPLVTKSSTIQPATITELGAFPSLTGTRKFANGVTRELDQTCAPGSLFRLVSQRRTMWMSTGFKSDPLEPLPEINQLAISFPDVGAWGDFASVCAGFHKA